MDYESLPHLLARVDLFADLPADARGAMAERGTVMSFQPGRVVVRQGADDAGIPLVVEGSGVVSVDDVERATLARGDYFGEISLLDNAPRSATVTAGPDGLRTFTLSPLVFSELLAERPAMARVLLTALCGRIRRIEASRVPAAD